MIKEIQKPNFYFNNISADPNGNKYYFDLNNKLYFYITPRYSINYFNLKGECHREDGYARIYFKGLYDDDKYFLLNNACINSSEFAEKTNHLICNLCNKFCKQGCF